MLSAGTTYSGANVKNLAMMMYAVGNGSVSNTYKVGMVLTSYGDNYRSYLDIYGGTSNNSVTRLGNLGGLTYNGSTLDNQWGLFTENGYFTGTINSTSGKIGDWTIGSYLKSSDDTVGASATNTNWAFWAGGAATNTAKFRVNHAGELWATNAHMTGEVTATSGTIGGASITNGVLQIANANITSLDASKINSGYIAAARINSGTITADKLATNTLHIGGHNLLKSSYLNISNSSAYNIAIVNLVDRDKPKSGETMTL